MTSLPPRRKQFDSIRVAVWGLGLGLHPFAARTKLRHAASELLVSSWGHVRAAWAAHGGKTWPSRLGSTPQMRTYAPPGTECTPQGPCRAVTRPCARVGATRVAASPCTRLERVLAFGNGGCAAARPLSGFGS
jgi:hypothetical protein